MLYLASYPSGSPVPKLETRLTIFRVLSFSHKYKTRELFSFLHINYLLDALIIIYS
jgi:hypothetical protein